MNQSSANWVVITPFTDISGMKYEIIWLYMLGVASVMIFSITVSIAFAKFDWIYM